METQSWTRPPELGANSLIGRAHWQSMLPVAVLVSESAQFRIGILQVSRAIEPSTVGAKAFEACTSSALAGPGDSLEAASYYCPGHRVTVNFKLAHSKVVQRNA